MLYGCTERLCYVRLAACTRGWLATEKRTTSARSRRALPLAGRTRLVRGESGRLPADRAPARRALRSDWTLRSRLRPFTRHFPAFKCFATEQCVSRRALPGDRFCLGGLGILCGGVSSAIELSWVMEAPPRPSRLAGCTRGWAVFGGLPTELRHFRAHHPLASELTGTLTGARVAEARGVVFPIECLK